MTFVRFLALATLVMGVLCACAATPPPSAQSVMLDKPLPAFRRASISGSEVSLGPAPGHVVVVKFFAKYCEPCMRTLPEAQDLHERYRDVAMVGIAEDEHQSDVEEMVAKFGLSSPIVHDRGNVLAGRFRVSELPATFVVDAQGVVRWVANETHSAGDLENAIEWARSAPAR
jgi:peroxiredoxin